LAPDFPAQPSGKRLAFYFLGRLSGLFIVSCFFALLGHLYLAHHIQGLFFNALCLVLAIFILLFQITHDSPEIMYSPGLRKIAGQRITLLGMLSFFDFYSPVAIYFLYIMKVQSLYQIINLFLYMYIGNCLIIIPHLMNFGWSKTTYFKSLLKSLLIFCSAIVLFENVKELLNI
jgi:hypothetical protein